MGVATVLVGSMILQERILQLYRDGHWSLPRLVAVLHERGHDLPKSTVRRVINGEVEPRFWPVVWVIEALGENIATIEADDLDNGGGRSRLDETETRILDTARYLGYHVAMGRLLNANPSQSRPGTHHDAMTGESLDGTKKAERRPKRG